MAVPIWERRSLILANWPVLAAVVCLSLICAIGSLVLLRGLLGDEVARALTLKSVTAPVALSIARGIGLPEHIALVGVMTPGMFGMVVGRYCFPGSGQPAISRISVSPWAAPRMASERPALSRSGPLPARSPRFQWACPPFLTGCCCRQC